MRFLATTRLTKRRCRCSRAHSGRRHSLDVAVSSVGARLPATSSFCSAHRVRGDLDRRALIAHVEAAGPSEHVLVVRFDDGRSRARGRARRRRGATRNGARARARLHRRRELRRVSRVPHCVGAVSTHSCAALAPMAGALAVAGLMLSFAPPHSIGPWWVLALLAALCVRVGALATDELGRATTCLPALAIVLSALGLLLVARLSPNSRRSSNGGSPFRSCCASRMPPCVYAIFADSRRTNISGSSLRSLLFVLLLFFGQEVNGARLWIKLGPVQYEPIELIKLFIVFFLGGISCRNGRRDRQLRDRGRCRRTSNTSGRCSSGGARRWRFSSCSATSAWRRCCWRRLRRCSTSRRGASTSCSAASRSSRSLRFGRCITIPYVQTRIAVWRNPFPRSARRGLSVVAGVLRAGRGRPVRHRLSARASRLHSRRRDRLRVRSVFRRVRLDRRARRACDFPRARAPHFRRRPWNSPISTRSCLQSGWARRSGFRSSSSSAASSASFRSPASRCRSFRTAAVRSSPTSCWSRSCGR